MDEFYEKKEYPINSKVFILENDFTFGELEWIDEICTKLNPTENELKGNFTKEDILKTLSIILRTKDGIAFNKDDFEAINQTTMVKIIGDFFLSKAIQGALITNISKHLREEKEKRLLKQTT